MTKDYRFTARMWLYQGRAAWHFISLPAPIAEEIRFFAPRKGPGWGAVRVTVAIGGSTWQTSIFPDKESGTFVLPIKADIRKREALAIERDVTLALTVRCG